MSRYSQNRQRQARKATVGFDELDGKIIGLLRENGRRTMAELSNTIGISPTATRSRVNKLIKGEILQVVAITNPEKLGLPVDVFVTVQTDPAKTKSVVEALGKLEEIRYVAILSGRYDVVFSSALESDEALFRLLTEKVGQIPGVARVETFRILKTTKRTYDRVWPVPSD